MKQHYLMTKQHYLMTKEMEFENMKLYAFFTSFDNLQIFFNNSFVLIIQFQENDTRKLFT